MITRPRTRLVFAAALVAGLLGACSGEPTAADKTEDGVRAALTEYVDAAFQGDYTAEKHELLCTEILTSTEVDKLGSWCEPPYEHTANSSWRELAEIGTVEISGDKATVQWYWRGIGEVSTHETTDVFYWEEGRWRYQYDG